MKLKYRGVTYEHLPISTVQGKPLRQGRYRGVLASYPTVTADVTPLDVELTYRGVTYRTGQKGKTVAPVTKIGTTVAPAIIPSASLEECMRQEMVSHHQEIARREQSMLMRTCEEVGLPREAAMHFQGYTPAEAEQVYGRSAVALS
jgi:Domain of unknown function (DUF4278)